MEAPKQEKPKDKPVSKSGKVFCKVVQLYAGLDLIGSKQSVTMRDAELEVAPMGIKMTSRKTKRVILLPWSNIKGAELLPEAAE